MTIFITFLSHSRLCNFVFQTLVLISNNCLKHAQTLSVQFYKVWISTSIWSFGVRVQLNQQRIIDLVRSEVFTFIENRCSCLHHGFPWTPESLTEWVVEASGSSEVESYQAWKTQFLIFPLPFCQHSQSLLSSFYPSVPINVLPFSWYLQASCSHSSLIQIQNLETNSLPGCGKQNPGLSVKCFYIQGLALWEAHLTENFADSTMSYNQNCICYLW